MSPSKTHAQTVPSAGQLASQQQPANLERDDLRGSLPATGPTNAPPGAENSFLVVGDVEVEGLEPVYQDRVEALVAPLRGKRQSALSLYELAAKIQALYAADGYFLTRVVIPPQQADHGAILKFKVLEGFISEVNVDAVDPHLRSLVARYLSGLKGVPRLRQEEFERALRLAAAISGLRLTSNLKPAGESLGVVLTLSGTYDPVSLQSTTSNSLSSALGSLETAITATLNSPFGAGDQIYISATGATLKGGLDASSPRREFSAGFSAPVTESGWQASVDYTVSGSKPIATGQSLATQSRFQRVSAKISYPLILNEQSAVIIRAGLDDIDETNRATGFDYTLYHDHLNVFRAGLDYNAVLASGMQLAASLDLSQGIDGLWARSAEDGLQGDPVSQANGSDHFSKLQARVHLRQELAEMLALDVSARGQFVPTGTVMNAEKFVFGGPGDLSGSDSGGWSGDHGWSLRGELQFDPWHDVAPFGFVLKPYVFAALAGVYVSDPSAAERAVDGATGFGAGLRGQWAPSRYLANPVDFALEIARTLPDHPDERPSTWRLNMSAGSKF